MAGLLGRRSMPDRMTRLETIVEQHLATCNQIALETKASNEAKHAENRARLEAQDRQLEKIREDMLVQSRATQKGQAAIYRLLMGGMGAALIGFVGHFLAHVGMTP